MADAQDPASGLLVIGINHRSAGPALRDRLFVAEPDASVLLEKVRAEGVDEAVVLSTCERAEVVTIHPDARAAEHAFLRALAVQSGLEPDELQDQSFRHRGPEAVRHLFAVAASLDSQMIGEPQVLGQIKDSHRRAADAGMVGPSLEAILQAAYGAAKRVRSETTIAQQPVSISAAALMVARDVHGDLTRRSALLVGLGEMGEFMAAELKRAGVRDLVIVHVSAPRAEAVARRLGCHYRPWEELEDALASADIVLGAAGAGRFSVTALQADTALKRRRREPMFVIDAAVPGDIDPAVAELDGAFVYDLEDLERVALQGKATREAASAKAWRILTEELNTFLRRRAERAAGPGVAALRHHFESVRADVLADGHLDAEEATRLLVNRLLHDPSEVLRRSAMAEAGPGEEADPPRRGSLERALRRLFRLGDDEHDQGGSGDRPAGKEDG